MKDQQFEKLLSKLEDIRCGLIDVRIAVTPTESRIVQSGEIDLREALLRQPGGPHVSESRGNVLVIFGPPGSGKTRKAEEISATAKGTSTKILFSELEKRFFMGSVLSAEFNTVIVEDSPWGFMHMERVRCLVGHEYLIADRKLKPPVEVLAPKLWIFTVQTPRWLNVMSVQGE